MMVSQLALGVHTVDRNSTRTMKDSDAPKCGLNAKPIEECITMQQHDDGTIPNILTKDWIINHPNSNVHQ